MPRRRRKPETTSAPVKPDARKEAALLAPAQMESSVLLARYNSLEEVRPYLEQPVENGSSDKSSPGEDWDYNVDYAASLQLARNGYKPHGVSLDREIDGLRYDVPNSEYAPIYDTCGESVDVGRYLEGEPECMIDYIETASNKMSNTRIIEILVNTSTSAGVAAKHIESRGKVVMGIAQALEMSGKSVGISVICLSKSGSSLVGFQLRIKQPDQWIDPDLLAFWLCHPAALRRSAFRLFECFPWEVRRNHYFQHPGTYGHPVEAPSELVPSSTIYYGNLHLDKFKDIKTAEDIEKLVKTELQERGYVMR
jgi:hypothetical protein